MGMIDLDKFQRRHHAVDLNRKSGSDAIFMKATKKDSFPVPYHYEFYCTSIEVVSETAGDVSTYGFYV